MAYLIQGVFFQDRDGKGPSPHEFAGKIQDGTNGYDDLSGSVTDEFSDAELEDISISPLYLSFVKRYNAKPYCDGGAISCDLEKQPDGIWLGTWTRHPLHRQAETGWVRCVLTEVPDAFFHSPDEALASAAV